MYMQIHSIHLTNWSIQYIRPYNFFLMNFYVIESQIHLIEHLHNLYIFMMEFSFSSSYSHVFSCIYSPNLQIINFMMEFSFYSSYSHVFSCVQKILAPNWNPWQNHSISSHYSSFI